jgi:hypothetical protein
VSRLAGEWKSIVRSARLARTFKYLTDSKQLAAVMIIWFPINSTLPPFLPLIQQTRLTVI